MTGITWKKHGGLDNRNEVGGDDQLGEAWSQSFTSDDVPGAMVTVSAYVGRDSNDPDATELYVEQVTEYLTFEDPEDIGGTCHWSHLAYDDIDAAPFETEEQGRAICRTYVSRFNPEHLTWDGKEFHG